jgi:hypothetical protein
MRFNLSEWAITHRALVLFMIIVLHFPVRPRSPTSRLGVAQ